MQYALEGSVFVGGAAVQWLRDGLGIIANSGAVEALARSVPDNGGVYFVPAFTGLGAPYWDPDTRGALVGLTRGTTAAHIARATLEAIAFQSADVLNAMQTDAGRALSELRVDGGGSRNALLMQCQADLLGAPVVCAQHSESSALGAASLAAIGAGFWSQTDIAAGWQAGPSYLPRISRDEAASRQRRWAEAVTSARSFPFKRKVLVDQVVSKLANVARHHQPALIQHVELIRDATRDGQFLLHQQYCQSGLAQVYDDIAIS